MARRDIYHDVVKQALQKDGWIITHDPYLLKLGGKRLEIDLGAECLISAEKSLRKIVIEIKSFVGRSDVRDLEQALGQYTLYHQILMEKNIDRELYLAVPNRTYKGIFQEALGAVLLKNNVIRLLVFDDDCEEIIRWIPN